jgi:hypothetical protein
VSWIGRGAPFSPRGRRQRRSLLRRAHSRNSKPAKEEVAWRSTRKGNVRIHYEDTGRLGLPVAAHPRRGPQLDDRLDGQGAPFNAIEEFKSEYRVVTADLRHAYDGQSAARSRSSGRGTRTPTTSSA